jgi:hypothetical protein
MTGLRLGLAGAAIAAGLLIGSAAASFADGALAVGNCGAYGYAFDFAKLDAAKSAALGKCTNGDCKVVTTMKHGCAALAIDGHNACGPNGYASAARLGQAQNTALKFCYRYGGKDCVIRAWACDIKG